MLLSDQIKLWIETGLPHSQAEVEGDGQHFSAKVICSMFSGKNSLQRHRMVYAALGDKMQGQIHALSLKTYTPDELEKIREAIST